MSWGRLPSRSRLFTLSNNPTRTLERSLETEQGTLAGESRRLTEQGTLRETQYSVATAYWNEK